MVIADEAGVNNEKYLNRARKLVSFLSNKNEEEGSAANEEQQINAQATPVASNKTTTRRSTRKTTI